MTIRLTVPSCLLHVALSVVLIAMTTPVAAQHSPQTAPACTCGPSALPTYVPPYPQPALRPLDGSPRSGVTYRHGTSYRDARTNLGTSAHEPMVGPALWSGLYVGAHGGYGYGKADARGLGSATVHGSFGGVHLGRNWQNGAFVAGLEADASKSWASGHRRLASGADMDVTRDWTGSLRGRAGYAFGNVLAYATAGIALAGQTVSTTAGGTTSSRAETNVGYVYGGGVAWQVMPQVSLHGEVLRYEFNDRSMAFGGAQVPVKLDETVVRGGLSFRFN